MGWGSSAPCRPSNPFTSVALYVSPTFRLASNVLHASTRMLTLCCHPHHSHGRLFLFNVFVTSAWRAKLSEYALDPYLKLTRGGLGEAGGYDLLPSEQHPANSVLFLSPEKCSGKMAADVQSQQQPTTAETIAPNRRGLRSRRSPAHSQPDWQPDESEKKSTRWLGQQRADVWAFGCIITSFALHQKQSKELHRDQQRDRAIPAAMERRAADEMHGWDEYSSVSKDRPGRCGRLTRATETVEEDSPHPGRRRSSIVDLKFRALGELAHYLKILRSAVSSRIISRSDDDESSSNAPLSSAPPSPPTSPSESVADPARTPSVSEHQTSAEERSPEPATRRRVRFESHPRPEARRLPAVMDTQPAHSNRRAIRGPKVPPTRYVLMLRLCQDKVSPLDGVTLSCCPKALLQLATQCCTRDPRGAAEHRSGTRAVARQSTSYNRRSCTLRRRTTAAASTRGVVRRRCADAAWCRAGGR